MSSRAKRLIKMLERLLSKEHLYTDDEIKLMKGQLRTLKEELNISDVYGEDSYTTMERNSIRPTLDVNGIWGGYTGEGAKTVIASKAFAKISMRLVPNQKSDEITRLFQFDAACI